MVRITFFNRKRKDGTKLRVIRCPSCGQNMAYSTQSPIHCSFCSEFLPDILQIKASPLYRLCWYDSELSFSSTMRNNKQIHSPYFK